jgi:D-sedoheptulose 7-phosphate isomerase
LGNGVVRSGPLVSIDQRRELKPTSAEYVGRVIDLLERLPIPRIDEVVTKLFQAYEQDCAVYLFGNGGSAALASHAACDLGKGTTDPGKRPFRVVSLTDNVSLITAWANDTSYDNVFAAQLRPFIKARDIAFAISGSGNSPNVLSALHVAREAGAFNIGLTGFHGGKMKALCDSCIIVPSENMQQIEDSHLCIMHAIFLSFRRCMESASIGET